MNIIGSKKTGFNLIIFHFNICGKLTIIQIYFFIKYIKNIPLRKTTKNKNALIKTKAKTYWIKKLNCQYNASQNLLFLN